jgi:hypothetical protein
VICGGCRHRWYGIDRAHCATCHRTFAEAGLFDGIALIMYAAARPPSA